MSERIKVAVLAIAGRKHYMLRWRDPMTGRTKTKSSGIEQTGRAKDRLAAEKAAAKFEAELQEGRYHEPNKVTWAEFRERYEEEKLPGLAVRTAERVAPVFGWVEKVLSPARLADLTEARISHLQAEMRKAGLSEATIKSNLAHLAAALRWANRLGMMPKLPHIEPPKRAKGSKLMKGRPITGEEFERMLAKIPAVVLSKRTKARKKTTPEQEREDAAIVASWERYLRGLWLSGLRLTESLDLWWDRDDRLCPVLTGKRPMLRIPAACEKGNQDRLLPMAPEFAEFLLTTPEAERSGPVFNPRAQQVEGERLHPDRVGRIITALGMAARVKVGTRPASPARMGKRAKTAKQGKEGPKEAAKYASAHDLRRSFGERWASQIMPTDLMVLMRHESIETTLRYYVGRNAEKTADALWDVYQKTVGNTFGNSGQFGASAPQTPVPEVQSAQGLPQYARQGSNLQPAD